MADADVAIIGGGVIGCAIAYQASRKGHSVILIEKGPRIAEGITSRNSGVIHAGIYYPPGSLKAEACIRGKALLYEWCEKYGVAHARTGKWIVGQKEDEAEMAGLFENAKASGATGLSFHALDEAKRNELGVSSTVGIYSSETGIVDPYDLTRSFCDEAEKNGAMVLTQAEVFSIEGAKSDFRLETSRGPLSCGMVFNCAGLNADEMAQKVGITAYKIYPWRGDYFRLKKAKNYKTLLYPVKKKNAPGLGVHLTIEVDGGAKLGPDVYLAEGKESFGEPKNIHEKRKAFYEAASKFLTGIQEGDLVYDSCGIRPKLRSPQDSQEKDFILSQDLPGFINLMGIESPGLTASLDLAERAVKMI